MARKFKRAIRQAERFARQSGRVHYVHFNGIDYTIYNRQGLKHLINTKQVDIKVKKLDVQTLISQAVYETSSSYLLNKIRREEKNKNKGKL